MRAPPGGQRRALYRPVDLERDQSYFLFATTPRPARFPAFSPRRHDQGRDPRARPATSALRSPTSMTARTSASSRTAATPTWSRACAGRREPATSSTSTGGSSAATRASSTTRSASGAGSASPTASRSTSVHLDRPAAASSSARAWPGPARDRARRPELGSARAAGGQPVEVRHRYNEPAVHRAPGAPPRGRRHQGRTAFTPARRRPRPGMRPLAGTRLLGGGWIAGPTLPHQLDLPPRAEAVT